MDTNLISWINKSIPDYVCKVPVVTYLDSIGNERRMTLPVVMANMQAIRECWELARHFGSASVHYSMEDNTLKIHPRGAHRNSNCGSDRYLFMYGNKIPSRGTGFPIVTAELADQICDYTQALRHACKKIQHSYGEMITLGGVNTDDVPLLTSIQDKTLEDWEKYRQVLTAEGSRLSNVTSSISDLERVLRPFQEGISTESGVPMWLLFPNKTSSQFELEERDIWARGLFQTTVLPVLLGLLQQQGYQILDIQPPYYRDEHYRMSVENMEVDTAYKESATLRNLTQVEATKAIESGQSGSTPGGGHPQGRVL